MKLCSLLFLALAPTAAAQSFNVDVGMNLTFFAGIPDSTYGGPPVNPAPGMRSFRL